MTSTPTIPSTSGKYQKVAAVLQNYYGTDLAEVTTRIAESGTATYIGQAVIGSSPASAVWSIRKLTEASSLTIILWADSNSRFDNVWDSRASLDYG